MDIKTENLEHRYMLNTPMERLALEDITISIPSNAFFAVIGHTGSGKSTLIQHLNGLLKPTKGSLSIGNQTIRSNEKAKNLKSLRKRVGIVFQYPEHQLFEETVEKDICFGPMNFGVSEVEAQRKAKEVLKLVGLPEELLQRSPFDLSGGQMRRVAIAGVLAMAPEVLILDEPTAGLDPRGQREIMQLFYDLHQQRGLTTILVTHSMEDASLYADEIVVMSEGKVYLRGTPEEIFTQSEKLQKVGLDVPVTIEFVRKVQAKFGVELPMSAYSIEEAARLVERLLRERTSS
jgi:energy-coupling factor transport system ATP-binding protein